MSVPKIVEVAVDVGIPCAGWAGGAIAGLLGSKCAPCAKPAGPALGIWVAPSDSPWAAWGPWAAWADGAAFICWAGGPRGCSGGTGGGVSYSSSLRRLAKSSAGSGGGKASAVFAGIKYRLVTSMNLTRRRAIRWVMGPPSRVRVSGAM